MSAEANKKRIFTYRSFCYEWSIIIKSASQLSLENYFINRYPIDDSTIFFEYKVIFPRINDYRTLSIECTENDFVCINQIPLTQDEHRYLIKVIGGRDNRENLAYCDGNIDPNKYIMIKFLPIRGFPFKAENGEVYNELEPVKMMIKIWELRLYAKMKDIDYSDASALRRLKNPGDFYNMALLICEE